MGPKSIRAIKGGLLIKGTDDPSIQNPIVIVSNGSIEDVGSAPALKIPAGAETLDLGQAVLMPGMMDLHLHMAAPNAQDYDNTDLAHVIRSPAEMLLDAAKNARLLLEAGFTTVRDLDWISGDGRNFCADLSSLREAIASGKLPGPRMVVAGFTHITGSHFDRIIPRNVERQTAYFGDGPWAMRRLARMNFRNGADLLKTCISGGTGTFDCTEHVDDRNIHIDELKAIVDEAHAFRRTVAAHCHTPDSVRMALLADVDTIEHCVFTDDDAIDKLASSGKYVVPTLAFREESVIEQRRARGTPDFVIEQMLEKRDISYETFQRYLKAGIRIAMGTDTHVDPPFGENAREIEIYARLGMTPLQAIQTATRNAADALGLSGTLGTVEKGKIADLIAIDGNPLEDVSLLRDRSRIQIVMKSGKIVIDRRQHGGIAGSA